MDRHHVTAAELADVNAPKSRFFHGGYGRLFPDLDPWTPEVPDSDVDGHLQDFVDRNMVEVLKGAKIVRPARLAADPVRVQELELRFNSNIPAGYTYFGQFVDHDMSFDPVSSLSRRADPNKLHNFRTPRLDLDCLYGRGPDAQPYLYDNDFPASAARFLVGRARRSPHPDLPRNTQGRALIGDMRNDENTMVSQLQLAFLLAHNRLVRRAEKAGRANPFNGAQRTLRWLYQWIVWHDYVRRITPKKIFDQGLQTKVTAAGATKFVSGFGDVYRWRDQPFMPVEFSGAVYRYGHSLVRNGYQTNILRGAGVFAPIFSNTKATNPDDLRGFRPVSRKNVIEWDWFLPMDTSGGPFPQMARKIDTKLANALSFLHEGPPGDLMNRLAFRNLKRGMMLGLPAGSDVAATLGVKPITLDAGEPDALWYYVLKEAETRGKGNRLGPVGATVLCAVFEGLLLGDRRSWVRQKPDWTPDSDPLLRDADKRDEGDWTLASIIRLSGLPTNAGEF